MFRTLAAALIFLWSFPLFASLAQPMPQINVYRFRMATGPGNIVSLDGSQTSGTKKGIFLSPFFEYDKDPLTLRDRSTKQQMALISDMAVVGVQIGVVIKPWLDVSLVVPIIPLLSLGSPSTLPKGIQGFLPPALNDFGFGDVRLRGKARILQNHEGGFGLGVVGELIFGFGSNPYYSTNGLGIDGHVALDYRFQDGSFIAINAGALLLDQQEFYNLRTRSQLIYGIGANLALTYNVSLFAEMTGSIGLTAKQSFYAPLEASGGVRLRIHAANIELMLGGSVPILSAPGFNYRFFVSAGYMPSATKAKEEPTLLSSLLTSIFTRKASSEPPAQEDPVAPPMVKEEEKQPSLIKKVVEKEEKVEEEKVEEEEEKKERVIPEVKALLPKKQKIPLPNQMDSKPKQEEISAPVVLPTVKNKEKEEYPEQEFSSWPFPEPLHFVNNDGDELVPSSLAIFKKAAKMIRANVRARFVIRCAVGFVDDSRINIKTASKRAKYLEKILLEQGIPKKSIKTEATVLFPAGIPDAQETELLFAE